jgi:hypothetical protein
MTGSVLRTRPVPRHVWQVLPTCWRLVRRWMFQVRPDPAQSRHFSSAGNCRITATSEQAAACNADGVALGFGLGGSACMGSIVLRIIHDDRLGVADAARASACLAGAAYLLAFGPALDVPGQARSGAIAAFFQRRELQDHGNLRTSRRMQRRWRCTWIRAWRVGVHGLNRSLEDRSSRTQSRFAPIRGIRFGAVCR